MSIFHLPILPERDDLHSILHPSLYGGGYPKASKTFINYLNKLKCRIGQHQLAWLKYKKYSNPYEFINTTIPQTNLPVSSLKPLSRSYYKMIELYDLFHLGESHIPLNTFHLAEGPGGFIEALCHVRNNPLDKHIGMTLLDDANEQVPGWHRTQEFLQMHPNVQIEKGVTQTGDIADTNNLFYCFYHYRGSMDLITADAGIDYSFDFNLQEHASSNLIICQVAFACAMLKKKGIFILKMFDISTSISVDILYFLSLVFDSVHIVKPKTSRYANSERYIVCEGFRLKDTTKVVEFFSIIMNHDVTRIFTHEIPTIYLGKLEECNAIIGQQQTENILATLSLIENPHPYKLESLKCRNIERSKQWCEKHDIPTNSLPLSKCLPVGSV